MAPYSEDVFNLLEALHGRSRACAIKRQAQSEDIASLVIDEEGSEPIAPQMIEFLEEVDYWRYGDMPALALDIFCIQASIHHGS